MIANCKYNINGAIPKDQYATQSTGNSIAVCRE